ncbi:MAG: alpha/beta fold hydrolase [Burkholderiales bacterium]
MVKLVMLPGLDGTGLLFRPLVASLSGIGTKVVTYPNDKALSLDEHARWVMRQLPGDKAVLLAESFSGLVALRMLQEALSRIAAVIFIGAFAEPPRPLLLRLAPVVSRARPLMRNTPAFLLRQFCLGRDAPVSQLNLLRETLAAVPPAEWFRARFERFELERIDGPHFLLQAKPHECAQRISEFSARIGV